MAGDFLEILWFLNVYKNCGGYLNKRNSYININDKEQSLQL